MWVYMLPKVFHLKKSLGINFNSGIKQTPLICLFCYIVPDQKPHLALVNERDVSQTKNSNYTSNIFLLKDGFHHFRQFLSC